VTARIAVLASGSGTNLQALLDYLDALGGARRAEVVVVGSDRRDAGALARARARGIATALIDPRDGALLDALLDAHAIDLVVLAGYLKLVPRTTAMRFRGRMLNVHPALLPAFGGPGMYGLRVHRAVLESGARVSGATVHFVDEAYDRGAIIAQWPVPVFEEDGPEELAARVLRVEHVLLPRVVDAVAGEMIALDDDGRVRGAFLCGPYADAFSLTRGGDTLAEDVDAALGR
jgi:phosphoribosylglycinamide formyltransferase 1